MNLKKNQGIYIALNFCTTVHCKLPHRSTCFPAAGALLPKKETFAVHPKRPRKKPNVHHFNVYETRLVSTP